MRWKFAHDSDWSRFSVVGVKWLLVSFAERMPQPYSQYISKEREYWGADRTDQRRFQHYFGSKNTEENFRRKYKAKYEEYCEHLSHWKGLCKVGEAVQAVSLQKNVIALSKSWSGSVRNHSDLELWTKKEIDIKKFGASYICEIYSFGTITVPYGSDFHRMGEAPGSSPVSHCHGKEVSVRMFDSSISICWEIGDATFRQTQSD